MRNISPTPTAEIASQAYDTAYYLNANGQPRQGFDYDPVRDTARAQAMIDEVGLSAGGRILDFGCGTGAITAACNELDYPTIGVDFSPNAIAHALPEARGRVYCLGSKGGLSLSDFPNDMVDLVIAKDVLEHVLEDELDGLLKQLHCIVRQVLAIIPTTDQDGNFVCKLFEQDSTHVTRLTRELWLGFFPCRTAFDLTDLTPQVRPSKRQVNGTVSLLLRESAEWREILMRERALRPTFRGLRPRTFKANFDRLVSGL